MCYKVISSIISILYVSVCMYAEESNVVTTPIVHIKNLNTKDTVYSQFIRELRDFNQKVAGIYRYYPEKIPNVKFYTYTPHKQESFIQFIAKLETIGQSSIITLNKLMDSSEFQKRSQLYIPSMPGLFYYENSNNDIEQAIRLRLDNATAQKIQLNNNKVVYFFPLQRLIPQEKNLFYTKKFIMPMQDFYITSYFGLRVNPISGHGKRHHNGIDIASKTNTTIYPTQRGEVQKVGYTQELGNFIRISHKDGYQSIYGHLRNNSILVKKGDKVFTNMVIAQQGNTGLSTGPHLHFEIHLHNEVIDPLSVISVKK